MELEQARKRGFFPFGRLGSQREIRILGLCFLATLRLVLHLRRHFCDYRGFSSHRSSSGDYTVRVRIGQTELSTSDFAFGAAIYWGICAIIYFAFGIIERRPIAALCGYAHLWMPAKLLFSGASYIQGIVPAMLLQEIPGHFVSRFLSAQLFLLVYWQWGSSAPRQEMNTCD